MKKNSSTLKIAATLALVLLSGCSSKGSSSAVPDENSKITSENNIISTEENTESTTIGSLKKPTVPTKLHPIDETNILILNENIYKKEDVVQKKDDYLLYKSMVSLSEAFPNMKYEAVNLPDKDVFFHYYNNGKFYSKKYTEECDTEKGIHAEGHTEIQSYDIESGKFTSIFETNSAAAILLCEGKYMIWQESDNNYWMNPSFHLYDLETGEDIKFYEAVLNEKKETSYYGYHNNTPLIIDDKIYYDDMIGIQEDGVSHYIIYCYDIKNKTLETVFDNAQQPTLYKGKLAWDNLSGDREHAVFCNEDETFFRYEYSLPTTLITAEDLLILNSSLSHSFMSAFDNTLPCVTNLNSLPDPEIVAVCHGVQIVRNNKVEPVIIGGISDGGIDNVKSDGRFVFWCGYGNKTTPTFYDSKTDKIIEVDFLPDDKIVSEYEWYIWEDNKIILTCNLKNGEDEIEYENQTYVISLNE